MKLETNSILIIGIHQVNSKLYEGQKGEETGGTGF